MRNITIAGRFQPGSFIDEGTPTLRFMLSIPSSRKDIEGSQKIRAFISGDSATKYSQKLHIMINMPVIISGRLDTMEFKGNKFPVIEGIKFFPIHENELPLINSVSLIGRLGADPDIRYFESGSVLAKSSLAISKGKNIDPVWIDIEAWGKTAEIMASYTNKGSQIGLSGELIWTASEEKVYWKVKASSINLLGSPRQIEEKEQDDDIPEDW